MEYGIVCVGVFVIVLGVVIGTSLYGVSLTDKEVDARPGKLQAVAPSLGLQYVDPAAALPPLVANTLLEFRYGEPERCALYGTHQGMQLWVFDSIWQKKSGRGHPRYIETAVLFVAPETRWPVFFVQPAFDSHDPVDVLEGTAGFETIEFKRDDLEWDYEVSARPQDRVAAFFSEAAFRFFGERGDENIVVESLGNRMLVYRVDSCAEIGEMSSFLGLACEVVGLFGPAPSTAGGFAPTPAAASHQPSAAPVPTAGARFCSGCGAGLQPGVRFCAACGTAVQA